LNRPTIGRVAAAPTAGRWTPFLCVSRDFHKRAQQLVKVFGIPPRLLSHVPEDSNPSLAPSVALTYREHGILCESLGRTIELAPQACNCNSGAPDTGNMQKSCWILGPSLNNASMDVQVQVCILCNECQVEYS
jgi:hypothetical protein